MADETNRGVDGITVEQLRKGRRAWWDAAFSHLLLEAIPRDCGWLVDLGCGLGRAAHDVLPALPALRYTGLDLDEARLVEARAEIANTSYAERADFVRGDLLALPFADASVDVAISVMTLQHVAEPRRALHEIFRVLRPGGVVVAIEPDNLDQRVYFGGARVGLADALTELWRQARAGRLPRDLAIGPELPSLFESIGFSDLSFRGHLCQIVNRESRDAFVERVRTLGDTISGAIEHASTAEALKAIATALDDFCGRVRADRIEFALMTTTVFRMTGRRPRA